MKKLLYIALIAVSSAIAFTSCSEEEVTPKGGVCTGGNAVQDELK